MCVSDPYEVGGHVPLYPMDWRIDPNFLEGNNPHPTEGLILEKVFTPQNNEQQNQKWNW